MINQDPSPWEFGWVSVSAISTAVVALLAVFGEQLRRRLFAPKVTITPGNKPPFVRTDPTRSHRTSGTEEVPPTQVSIKVENKRLTPARECSVIVSEIFAQRDGGDYYHLLHECIPTSLGWDVADHPMSPRNRPMATSTTILKGIPAFLGVAQIALPTRHHVKGTEGKKGEVDSYDLHIRIPQDGKFVHVKCGRAIVPITITCQNLQKAKTVYLKINWGGATKSDVEDSSLEVKVIGNAEFKRLVEREG